MMNGHNSLKEMIPKIRRARDYHVYDFSGQRFLDLWLDDGRAFLGHKYGRTILMMKNCLEKGLSAAYPGVWEDRLLRQVKLLYPEIRDCSVVFSGLENNYPLVRPFENDELLFNSIFELLIPTPGSTLVKVLCNCGKNTEELPPSSAIPQFLYSALCRSLADLVAIKKTLNPAKWNNFNAPFWERKGPWLFPTVNKGEYKKIFSTLLKEGIILSPDVSKPSCAPYRFTDGEIHPIKKLAKEF